MAEYTPPGNDNVDFEIDTSESYTPPDNDSVDFTLKAFRAPELSLDVVSGDEIDLTWTASGGGQDGYRVYRAEASGSTSADYTQVTDVGPDTTAYADTGLEDGERYFYRVEAYQSDGDTTLSNEDADTTTLPAAADFTPDTSVEGEITLSWTREDDSPDGTWELYRSEDGSLGSLIETFTDLSATSYTDTGLDDGEEYVYTLRRVTDHATADATQSAIALLPAPTDLSLSPGTREIGLSWTVNHDDGTQTVQFKRSSDATWTDWMTGLSLSTTSATITGLLDGEEYDVRVLAVNDTTTAAVDTATTALPDAQQPSLNNGIEDELSASWTDVINYGDYRAQIRETGQDTWDSSATGFAEQVVDGATTSVTFGGLEDGEAYEVRLRTETEHTTGAWTDLVDAVTAFPTPANVSVSSTAATGATVTWDDQADNEDGFRILVAEERFGSFGSDEVVQTLAPNTEQATLNLKPDTTYRVTVEAFTEDAAVDESVELTTDPPAVATDGATQVPASGPHLEIDHPSNGRTLTPTITGEVAPPRALNELPTTTVEVRGDKWLDDVFVGADVRLYLDGRRQPADTLVRLTATPEGAELQLRGGSELIKRVEKTVVEQEADDFVRQLLQTEAPTLKQNVDDPDSTTLADTPVASASTQTEWENILRNYPFANDNPRQVQNGTLTSQRVAAYAEAENGSFVNTPFVDSGNQFAAGEAVAANAIGDSVEVTLDIPYPIPDARAELFIRFDYAGSSHPGFDVLVDGTAEASITADTDFLGGTQPRYTDLGTDIGQISAGTHTVTVDIETAASDSSELFIDCVTIIDSQFVTMNETEKVSNGGRLSTPNLFPDSLDILTDDVGTVRQVAGGELTTSYNNTGRNQQVAISNDQGANYLTADNAETVDGSFASGSSQIRGRFTLSNFTTTPPDKPTLNAVQEISSFDLTADLDTAPLLVDQAYDGELRSILNEVADFSDAIWEVRFDQSAGSQVVEWTFPGQREASGDPSVIDFETSVDATSIIEKAVVYGTSKRVTDEQITADVGTAVALNNDYNQPADITVTSSDGSTTYDRGTDYEFDPQDGTVTALSGGNISDSETLLVDYRTRVRGVYEAPSFSGDETLATTETIPAATTDRSAETAALVLVDIASEPITSADVVIEDLRPGTQLVEVVSFVDLPTDASFEVYSVANDGGRITLRLGTRDTINEVVSRLQSRLEATASKI